MHGEVEALLGMSRDLGIFLLDGAPKLLDVKSDSHLKALRRGPRPL